MEYIAFTPTEPVLVKQLVTVHYFEYCKDFAFAGEQHPFWEFLYVDKGAVCVRAGEKELALSQGQIIFHQPGEFHNVTANGTVAPNLVVVSFVCESPAMDFFAGQLFELKEEERRLIGTLVREAGRAFSTPLGDPFAPQLARAGQAPFAGEQMVKLMLELLLIRLIRGEKGGKNSTAVFRRAQEGLYGRIDQYLEEQVENTVTVEDICRLFSCSRSTLKQLFHTYAGRGVMESFRTKKLERAKRLIREEELNFTAISERLQFSSVHYFSRCFKKGVGMTPTEYARSVKVLTEGKEGVL